MKITVVGLFMKDSFGSHIHSTLLSMGHDSTIFSVAPNTYVYKNSWDYLLKKVLRKVHSFINEIKLYRQIYFKRLYNRSIDKDLIIVTHDFLRPGEIECLKRNNSRLRIVLWFPDAISMIGKQFFLSSKYDMLFFKDRFIVDKISSFTNIPVYYLPECFNPTNQLSSRPDVQDIEISVIGNFHTWRVASLEVLSDLNIHFFGVNPPFWLKNSWMNKIPNSPPVYDLEKTKVILRSKINLNNLHIAEVEGANVRLFEINGSGGFQICSFSECISDLYAENDEIVLYRNRVELREKVEYYLKNPIERLRISSNAQKRTLEEHTYFHRLSELLLIAFKN